MVWSKSSKTFLSAGDLRSRSQVCFPVFPSTWKKGTSERWGEVTLITCAPYSASVRPMAGPAMMRQSSRTRMPDSICGLELGVTGSGAERNETGGDES